jgi:hypothetical protein
MRSRIARILGDERGAVQARPRAALPRTLRRDVWWIPPIRMAVFLATMIAYSTWAGLQRSNYFAEPYVSPIFSPCLAVNCEHATFRLLGGWWTLSPALAVMWLPIGFRVTCYYYRKAYYRAFWLSPPACAVAEPHRRYTGETRFPLIVQNLHRYFFYLMIANMVFLTWDTGKSFFFADGFGIGVGTIVMVIMILSMAFYMLSCHSCRHLCGGFLDAFAHKPLRHRLWQRVSKLNENHGWYALFSLAWIPLTDLYIRLVASGTIRDLRLF